MILGISSAMRGIRPSRISSAARISLSTPAEKLQTYVSQAALAAIMQKKEEPIASSLKTVDGHERIEEMVGIERNPDPTLYLLSLASVTDYGKELSRPEHRYVLKAVLSILAPLEVELPQDIEDIVSGDSFFDRPTDFENRWRALVDSLPSGRPGAPPHIQTQRKLYDIQWAQQRVTIDEHAGGFPKIMHGGLLGYLGFRLLFRYLSDNFLSKDHRMLPSPYELSVRLVDKLEPGMQYAIHCEGDLQRSVVHFRRSSGMEATDLAKVTWAPKELHKLVERKDLVERMSVSAYPFHCLPNCVAFGTENPKGLKLAVHYRMAPDSKPEHVWTPLNEASGSGLLAQLMAIDELAWWMGKGLTDRAGVTVTYSYRPMSAIQPGDKLFVVAERPEDPKAASKRLVAIPVSVISQSGRLIAQSFVRYRPVNELADAGMGAEGDAVDWSTIGFRAG